MSSVLRCESHVLHSRLVCNEVDEGQIWYAARRELPQIGFEATVLLLLMLIKGVPSRRMIAITVTLFCNRLSTFRFQGWKI